MGAGMAKVCPACGREHRGSHDECGACRNRAAAAARLRALKEAGLCTRCGKLPARPGRTWCEECAGRASAEYMAKSAGRREAGLCPLCGERPPAPGRKVCAECAGKRREYRMAAMREPCDGDCLNCQYEDCIRKDRLDPNARARQRYQALVMDGRCPRCGAPAEAGHALCAACLARGREYARKTRMRGKGTDG